MGGPQSQANGSALGSGLVLGSCWVLWAVVMGKWNENAACLPPRGRKQRQDTADLFSTYFLLGRGARALSGPCRGIFCHSQAGCCGHKHLPRRFRDHHPHVMLSCGCRPMLLTSFDAWRCSPPAWQCCSNLIHFSWDCHPWPPLGRMGRDGWRPCSTRGVVGGQQEAICAY